MELPTRGPTALARNCGFMAGFASRTGQRLNYPGQLNSHVGQAFASKTTSIFTFTTSSSPSRE